MAAARIAGLDKIQQLQPWLAPFVLSVLEQLARYGIGGKVYDVYRSPAAQQERYDVGDSKAKPGQSAHQYGLAFDFVVTEGEKSQLQRQLQAWWRSIGFGTIDWDPAHVEFPNWQKLVGR